MQEKSEAVVAESFRLKDLIGGNRIEGDIEIINECNETLLMLSFVEDNVCTLEKTLHPDLLSRKILNTGVRDGRLLIKIEGVEDAD